jgi:selenide,water dikinase
MRFGYAAKGCITGASGRNWASYGEYVESPDRNHSAISNVTLLTDPQTSGGLLVACTPEVVTEVLAIFPAGGLRPGNGDRRDLGEGKPQVSVLKSQTG